MGSTFHPEQILTLTLSTASKSKRSKVFGLHLGKSLTILNHGMRFNGQSVSYLANGLYE